MRISPKGQVTIPAEIRAKLALAPNTEVNVTAVDDMIIVRKKEEPLRGEALIKHLTSLGSRANTGMSTDEIMKLTRGYSLEEGEDV